jgi:hypothetical protein
MLAPPPHISNKLQPLDVWKFSSFKCFYDSNSNIVRNKGNPLSIYDAAGAMTQSNIHFAFKKTGIFPFDPNVFTDDDFMINAVTKK